MHSKHRINSLPYLHEVFMITGICISAEFCKLFSKIIKVIKICRHFPSENDLFEMKVALFYSHFLSPLPHLNICGFPEVY